MVFVSALVKYYSDAVSQQTFTCSNSTIETLEKAVKYVQNTRATSVMPF